MNIKTFMAAAVIALTAACSPTEDVSVAEAAGPAADAALSAAEGVTVEAPAEDAAAPEATEEAAK